MNWPIFLTAVAGTVTGLLVGVGIVGFALWWNVYREHPNA